MIRYLSAALFVSVLGITSYQSRAQDAPTTEPAPYWANQQIPGPRAETPFPQGSFDLWAGAAGLTTFQPQTESLGFLTLGGGYFVLDRLSVNFEIGLAPGTLDDSCADPIRAFEGQFLARWHFLRSGRVSLFAEGGVGGLHAEHFGHTGSDDDLMLTGGFGAAFRVSRNIHLTLGARYTRLTGGDLFSDQGRHHADAINYGIGLMIVK